MSVIDPVLDCVLRVSRQARVERVREANLVRKHVGNNKKYSLMGFILLHCIRFLGLSVFNVLHTIF